MTASVSYDSENTHTEEFQNQNRNQWLITDSATGPYVGPLQPAGLTHLGKNYIDPQFDYFTDRYRQVPDPRRVGRHRLQGDRQHYIVVRVVSQP